MSGPSNQPNNYEMSSIMGLSETKENPMNKTQTIPNEYSWT
jgi:hypothetical protein